MRPGDVVTADFPGVTGVKRRPAIVLSTEGYHRTRPDVILGLVTSQVAAATQPSDCQLLDWKAAGLHRPSAFRAFLFTLPAASVRAVGRLSDRDFHSVQAAVKAAIAVS